MKYVKVNTLILNRSKKIEINFKLDNFLFFDKSDTTIYLDEHKKFKSRVFELVSCFEIEEFDSILYANLRNRDSLLKALSIVTYFTGDTYTVADNYNQTKERVLSKDLKFDGTTTLIINRSNQTNNLKILLKAIETDEYFVISLLDRWRKANYLLEISTESSLFNDEVILIYFHIIELIAEKIGKEFRDSLTQSVHDMASKFYMNNITIDQDLVDSKIRGIKSILQESLIDKEINLTNKVIFFLKKHKMYNKKTIYFLKKIVTIRNSVAHGREVYNPNHIYPLPPFYSLTKEANDLLKPLRIFTAKMIGCYVGIDKWDSEWEKIQASLIVDLKTFISVITKLQTKNEYKNLNGVTNKNIWKNTFFHYIEHPKKLTLTKLTLCLKNHFITAELDKNNKIFLFEVSVIFADSGDESMRERAIRNVHFFYENSEFSKNHYRDFYYFLEYKKIKTIWYKDFLTKNI